MSAYIVDDKTINNIVCTLAYGHTHGAGFATYGGGRPFRDLPNPYKLKTAPQTTEQELEYKRLAFDLYKMNCAAVDQRYNEKNPCDFTPRLSPFAAAGNLTQIYKSTKCLLYQCSEGDVINTPLYDALRKLAAFFAQEIVERSEAWEKSTWG
jgi:hypothetical protein